MENEIFKPAIYIHKDGTIEDLSDRFEISNLGRVYSKISKKILKTYSYKFGYPYIAVTINRKTHNYTIHRLILSTFQPESDTYECINHKDENPENSVLSNIEWCTTKYNMEYSDVINKGFEASVPVMSKTVYQFDLSGNFIREWKSTREIERVLNIPHNNVSYCCNGKNKKAYGYIWKYASNCDHIS